MHTPDGCVDVYSRANITKGVLGCRSDELERQAVRTTAVKDHFLRGEVDTPAKQPTSDGRGAAHRLQPGGEGVEDEHARAQWLANAGGHLNGLEGLQAANDARHCENRADVVKREARKQAVTNHAQ